MARVKRAQIRTTRLKNLRARAKGFFGARKNLRQAHEAVMHAEKNAYIGRKQRKQHFRRLWTVRINAATRAAGLSYSKFIHGMKLAGIDLNRKMLSDLATREPAVFADIVAKAKAALA